MHCFRDPMVDPEMAAWPPVRPARPPVASLRGEWTRMR